MMLDAEHTALVTDYLTENLPGTFTFTAAPGPEWRIVRGNRVAVTIHAADSVNALDLTEFARDLRDSGMWRFALYDRAHQRMLDFVTDATKRQALSDSLPSEELWLVAGGRWKVPDRLGLRFA